MPKRTTADKKTAINVVIVTLDSHLAGAVARARSVLRREIPGLELSLHVAAEWSQNADALERAREAIRKGDIIIATMLFMDEHISAVLDDLKARRDRCDALVACMSAGEVIKLTRLGRFNMGAKESGIIALLKRLRGSREPSKSSGSHQMAFLRRLPKLLRFIPGTAQDVRAFFLTMQYWLACSDVNLANMVRMLINRYASGPREALRDTLQAELPIEFPDVGLYHPRLTSRISEDAARLPKKPDGSRGTVGLLLMRSYVLAGDTAHYDGLIDSFEKRGLRVVAAFASGLDARPAIEKFFVKDGAPTVDAVVSITGFSLVGGPAYNDAKAAEEMLTRLDVPYMSAQALEFQSLEQWQASDLGLMPIESTMMVAIPELDGAINPAVYGGRHATAEGGAGREMECHGERAAMLSARVERLIRLRRSAAAEKKIAIVLFGFPPNAGSVGTAAYLSVFESLHRTLETMQRSGYTVDPPADVDALREAVLHGNAVRFGATANVHARISADDHVRTLPWLEEIEAQWGPAPGRHQSDGRSIFVLGADFGNVFVGVQPAFGYEGDPMRLLFEKGFAPTHAFAAFYRYIREDFGAHAVLHFGTHGALEFMPGKQSGLSGDCWPDRLIGDLPNFYLYAANNPSEGAIAKRRSAATLISYMTPPVVKAGLYRGLLDLKASLERLRALPPEAVQERDQLVELVQTQAAELDLINDEAGWADNAETNVTALAETILELEYSLIPHGLHVVGEPPSREERIDLLLAMAESMPEAQSADGPDRETVAAIVDGFDPDKAQPSAAATLQHLCEIDRMLCEDAELPALMRALDGRYIRPVPGGDLLRTPEILPTGRNLHGFDPFRIPSAFAMQDGAHQADRLIARHVDDGNALPETVALVLWGTDNMKREGAPIAQALSLLGTKPRFDSFGRLCGAELIPLEELGRPRIDVLVTLSGIFRDLLPIQTRMLAEAAFLAASADEPLEKNFVRKHALAYRQENGCDLETAALRVFSNAEGAYGSNVNHLIDSGCWDDEEELADAYERRKCFAYGLNGKPAQSPELLASVLSSVSLTYQNLESVELGVTTVDHYFDTLGGISRAVRRAKGSVVPAYIGDETRGEGRVRTLREQVELETRTRALNPKWYEAMLEHGHEGVRQIEAQVTNTMGWSATTGEIGSWVYERLTETFVLDEEMRARLAELNPTASVNVANRLLEAHEREYWTPDEEVLEALRKAGDELEDRLEGVTVEAAA